MSTTTLNDDWVQCQSANALANEVLTWTTSISRSRISTADGLGLSENVDSGAVNSLESLLRIVQQLKLKRVHVEDIEEVQFIASGETFSVSQCNYEGKVVAIKRIRLNDEGRNSDRQHFQRCIHAVLREILISSHSPITHHPNIITLLGYGWSMQMQQVSPFISLEFASGGSLRNYMKVQERSIRTKLILIGDVGTGLMALHRCGIVHGDLKADNVVVFASLDRPSMSIAKVSDFGHSIILSSASQGKSNYVGTVLYNAPEVAHQRTQPIPLEQLHKCDIWAFGLCVWEILANGEIYFKHNWRTNPIYHPPPLYESTTSSADPKFPEEFSIEGDSENVFGKFDLHHTKALALEFLNSMVIPGIGFEKGFLRPLLNGTLNTDPTKRISDLNTSPVIGLWNRLSGVYSLQSKLAIYTLSGDIRYSIFSRGGGPYIIWDQQQQLLQDFETLAEQNEPEKNNESTIFQTMLCYVNAFGTSMNLSKATQFLQAAEKTKHLMARILGSRLLEAFSEDHFGPTKEYSQCLALGFRKIEHSGMYTAISVHTGDSVTQFADYTSFRDALVRDTTFEEVDMDDLKTVFCLRNGSSKRHNILEMAIQQGDTDLLGRLLPFFCLKPEEMEPGECLLVQAARQGHGNIVSHLLQEGVTVACDSSGSCLLHWLFCLNEIDLSKVQIQLQAASCRNDRDLVINRAITEKIPLHHQWPFQVHGTPLATAIASGSIAAVKTLLSLKADPTAAAFVNSDDDSDPAPVLTPIHLAISYHFPEIVKILWYAAFGERKISINRLYLARVLGSFPIACSLSLRTNAERFAIHGSRHQQSIRETIELLPLGAFTQTSPEGKDAITQAIDLEDLEAMELILQRHPELASRRLCQPGTDNMFTYPLHFSAQIGALRDTEESTQILSCILKLDPNAINRPDSSSAKPIHAAAMGTSTRMLNVLLNHGATCHDLDAQGQTPLFFCRSANVAKALLSSGADPNHKDQLGFTPVHAAINQGSEEVLQVLIESGANLTYSDNGNGSPLHCAVKRRSLSMVEMLLKAKVEVDARDTHSCTPLLVAMDTGRSDLVSILFENGADPFITDKNDSSPLHMALAWPNASMLNKFQIRRKLDPLPWKTRIAALHFAAEKGEPEALKLYLSKAFGSIAREDRPTFLYHSEVEIAVHKATLAYRADLLETLLAYGVAVDAKDTSGNTPIMIACQPSHERPDFDQYSRTNICETLINYGANIQEKNHRGLTPFSVAQAHAYYAVMTLLLDYALSFGDLDSRSRMLGSIKSPKRDKQHCQESRALISDEFIDLQLLRQAPIKEEWDFFMTCIGGNFVGKDDLLQIFPRRKWSYGVDSLDILRFQCARREREIVRYIYQIANSGTTMDFKFAYLGERNLQKECSECRASLNATLWPKKMAKLLAKNKNDQLTRRNSTDKLEKRWQEFQYQDSNQGTKWGWSSDGLSDDPPSSDEESNTDERHETQGEAKQDHDNDVDMNTKNPEESWPDDLEGAKSRN